MGRLKLVFMAAALAWTTTTVWSIDQAKSSMAVVDDSAREAIAKVAIAPFELGRRLNPDRALVLTSEGLVGLDQKAQLPQIEVQVGRVDNQPLYAVIGVGPDVSAPAIGLDVLRTLSKELGSELKGAKPGQAPILMCAADGPCIRTCPDPKTGKPFCCRYQCQ